jgi:hypothetical protein
MNISWLNVEQKERNIHTESRKIYVRKGMKGKIQERHGEKHKRMASNP